MIPPDRLERYKDFVDPERTGEPYDPRKGLERLLGVLSPDPKGIVLAAMGSDWYGNSGQLYSGILRWLDDLGLSKGIWPIHGRSVWSYCERRDTLRQRVDGSLVELGAVVKKAEDPSQVLYSRSVAGTELAVPLVQQAVRFVSKARESIPHKFDSMWRILGHVASRTDQRRPLAVWDTIDFLVHNSGGNRRLDIHSATHISPTRVEYILSSLGNCGIIDYVSPLTEVQGQRGWGWVVYTLVDRQSAITLDSNKVYQDIRGVREYFKDIGYLTRIIEYIKEYPDNEYEHVELAEKLGVNRSSCGRILSLLADLDLLKRMDLDFEGSVRMSSASANDLTRLFYDLVCEPAKEVVDTLSPLSLRPWDRKEVVVYLGNYSDERSQIGQQTGEDTRKLLLEILFLDREGMKLSHIVDLYNDQADRELKVTSIATQLKTLLKSGQVEQPRPGYYRLARSIS